MNQQRIIFDSSPGYLILCVAIAGAIAYLLYRGTHPWTDTWNKVLLAARFHPLWPVIAGTTLGMMLADGPAVLLGARFAPRLPMTAARWIAAGVLAALGIWVAIYGLGNPLS